MLDTPPEREFDDLTYLAAQICDTPIALITLLDQERQWFKSCVGLTATETPRDISFCAHAILEHELLVIPDATADERFADNPFVTGEPHVRFYAGAPLVTPEGQALGTLCVIDTVPRQLDQNQQEALRRLGRQVIALLEARPDATTKMGLSRLVRHQAERQRLMLAAETARQDADRLEVSEVRYRRLFEAAQDGILILDAASGKIEDVNPYLCDLLGYARDDFLGKQLWEIGTFQDIVANQDAFRKLQEQAYIRYNDLPLATKEGQRISVEFVSNVYTSGAQEVIQCNIRSITQRKEAESTLWKREQQFRAVFDNALDAIIITDNEGRFLEVNEAACELYGVSREQLLSMKLSEFYAPAWDFAQANRDFRAAGRQKGEFQIVPPGGTEKHVEYAATADFLPNLHLTALRDITERKRAEAALHESEIRYRALAEAAPDGVFIVNRDGIMQYINHHSAQRFGLLPEAVVGKSLMELFPPQIAEVSQHDINRVFQSGAPRYEERHLTFQNRDFWMGTWLVPLKNAAGEVTEVMGVARDITEQKQLEATLRASESRYRSLFEANPQPMWVHDVETLGFLAVNDAAIKHYGYSRDEFLAMTIKEIRLPEDIPVLMDSLLQSMPSGGTQEICQLRKKDGTVIDVELSKHELSFEERPARLAMAHDITARQQAEAQRDRFFTMAVDILGTFGLDGKFKQMNPAFTETLGFTKDEIIEQSYMDWVHPEDQATTLAAVATLTEGNSVLEFENRYRTKSGSYRWLEWKAVPIMEEGLIYAAARDVTERKKTEHSLRQTNDDLESRVTARTAELAQVNETLRIENIQHQMTLGALRLAAEALQQAKEEADTANAAKSEFLSRMSHELRTPLNAILGFGQILNRQELPPLAKESVSYILNGGRHLLDLINEVLDIARVEAGRLELSLEPIALDDIVPEACALVRPLAAERHIRLDENTATLGRAYILADRQRLKQALINLLSNAIKYNRDGGQVEVTCTQKLDGQTTIEVRDTGPGIAPQDLPKLFTPFERLNAGASDIEGTGLGLVLSQRLVTAMGGTLSVTSTLGQGTTFTIELPQATSPEQTLTQVAQDTGHLDANKAVEHVYTVLCIEDNPPNLRLMEAILEDRPEVTLLTAMQGSVGLDLARQHEPHLILLDLNLPDIHGREVLARLQQSALTRDIPVVIISADATPHQIERLLDAGAVAYLTKPLDVGQFLDTLDKFLQAAPGATGARSQRETG